MITRLKTYLVAICSLALVALAPSFAFAAPYGSGNYGGGNYQEGELPVDPTTSPAATPSITPSATPATPTPTSKAAGTATPTSVPVQSPSVPDSADATPSPAGSSPTPTSSSTPDQNDYSYNPIAGEIPEAVAQAEDTDQKKSLWWVYVLVGGIALMGAVFFAGKRRNRS